MFYTGLTLWLSVLSCHVQNWPVTLVPVQTPAAPLLVLLPAKVLGKTVRDGLNAWTFAATWVTWRKLWVPEFILVHA